MYNERQLYGVDIAMLKNPEQRHFLKILAVNAKTGYGLHQFAVYIKYCPESHQWLREDMSANGEDEKQLVRRFIIKNNDHAIYFNSIDSLLSLIEVLDAVERENVSVNEKKEENHKKGTSKGIFRRVISTVYQRITGK